MGSFYIKGPKKLSGKVRISGSKNEALKLIPLSICVKGAVTIKNVPKILDISSQLEIFEHLGGTYKFDEDLTLDATKVSRSSALCDKAKSLRASIVYLGPLLARFKKAQVPFPGGCAIGSRPIDTHLDAFRDLGANITIDGSVVSLAIGEVTADRITLKEKSVSATENVLLFLSAIKSRVKVSNCAVEPEILHLVEILKEAGARITQVDDRTFDVEGSEDLEIEHIEVMPDRIEAGTFAIAFLATGGEGEITPFEEDHLGSLVDVLRGCGATINIDKNKRVCKVAPAKEYKSFKIRTGPYPEFPTDLQSPMALIASRANGTSSINETMFENRLGYLKNLGKMGLKYGIVDKHNANITGLTDLSASRLESPDLRSGITMLLAAIMANGESRIDMAEIIDRGYENIEVKLNKLGADIKRVDG